MAPCLVKASSSYYTRGSWQSKRATWRVLKLMCGRETDGEMMPRSSRLRWCRGRAWLAGWRASFGSTQRTEQVDRVGDAGALFPSSDGDAFSDVFIWVDSSLACERWRASWTWGRSEAKGLCDTRRAHQLGQLTTSHSPGPIIIFLVSTFFL